MQAAGWSLVRRSIQACSSGEVIFQDVVGLIQAEELEDIVLCGHSYGGMVITGVAEALSSRIDAMVYLDAFVPEPHQSLVDAMPEDRREKARLAFSAH